MVTENNGVDILKNIIGTPPPNLFRFPYCYAMPVMIDATIKGIIDHLEPI